MPELFLLHGMGGSPADWSLFEQWFPGKSIAIPSAASPKHAALALADQIELNAQGRIALCGYSMGGRLALLTAVELFARARPPSYLILASTGLGSVSLEEQANRRKLDEEWASAAEKNLITFWERWYQQPLFSSYLALHAEQRRDWENSRLSMDIGSLTNQLRNLGPGNHDDLAPLLEGLLEKGLRVLYIVGELDKKYLELSRKVGEMKGVQTAVIPGAGHILPLEAPKELASRIREFLK